MMPRVTDTARRIVVLVKDFSDYQLRANKKKKISHVTNLVLALRRTTVPRRRITAANLI